MLHRGPSPEASPAGGMWEQWKAGSRAWGHSSGVQKQPYSATFFSSFSSMAKHACSLAPWSHSSGCQPSAHRGSAPSHSCACTAPQPTPHNATAQTLPHSLPHHVSLDLLPTYPCPPIRLTCRGTAQLCSRPCPKQDLLQARLLPTCKGKPSFLWKPRPWGRGRTLVSRSL